MSTHLALPDAPRLSWSARRQGAQQQINTWVFLLPAILFFVGYQA